MFNLMSNWKLKLVLLQNGKCLVLVETMKVIHSVETEKMERVRRLLEAVEIKKKEKEPTSKQSLPLKLVHSAEELSKKEEKQHVKKIDLSKDLSMDSENRENEPHQINKHSIKQDNKKNEHDKMAYEYLKSSASSKSNTDEDKLNIVDKEILAKHSENEASTLNQINDASFLSLVNHNLKKNDYIKDLMITEMDAIIMEAKDQRVKMTSEVLVKCGIWDFAGEKDYYATHQTFLTPNAIYILVADITEDIKAVKQDEEFNSIEDYMYIDFWFDCIHCFCEESSYNAGQLRPPVLMVCTGTDKVEKVEERKVAFNKQFDRIFYNQTKVNHRRGIYFLSNKEEGHKEINNLKDHISRIAKHMDYFSEILPTKWIHLENALAVLTDVNIDVFEWENMLKLAQNNSIEEDELLRFLNYQHKIGNVIFFNELREYIILQPAWLVKCFRCLVDDWNPEKRKDAIILNETACQTLKTTGELSETLIDQLFEKEPTLQFGNRKRHLLHVMEKFDIIVQPEFRDTENDKCQKSRSYYLPCMIEKSLQFDDIKNMFIEKNSKVTITPWLVFEFEFLPLAYFNHILFYYVRKYTVCKVDTGYPALYLGKAVFYVDRENHNKFIVCFSQNAISLQVWNWSDVDEDMYKQMFSELCDKIENIRGSLGQNISYNIKAKCSLGDFYKRDGRISLTEITNTKNDVYLCKEHQQNHSKEDIEKTWWCCVDDLK